MIKKLASKFKKNKKKIIAWMIVVFVILLGWLMFKNSINTIISDTIELKSKALATRAMNSAIADVVINSIVYEDLVNIITDELGNISMIQANSLEINNLSKDLAQTTEIKIEEYGRNGVGIPIGSFTGIPLFVGRGPKLKLKVNPIGAVNCSFLSRFETAGINQTNHKIYLEISADVGVVLPLLSSKYNITREVLISESIIVGQVPEVYLYSDTLDTLLNFVPY
ncbi:MAG: sporulation protein YunB [Clostridia bacterium]|nr:sporulation protein YunB [Clostridia bacterium]